jgi:WD40 repeat protein
MIGALIGGDVIGENYGVKFGAIIGACVASRAPDPGMIVIPVGGVTAAWASFLLVVLIAWIVGEGDPGRRIEQIWIFALYSIFALVAFVVTCTDPSEGRVVQGDSDLLLTNWLPADRAGLSWVLLRLVVLLVAGGVWWVYYGDEFARLDEHDDDRVNSVCFDPQGIYVLTGSDDGTALLWPTGEGWSLQLTPSRRIPVLCLATSANGRVVAAGGGRIEKDPDTEKVSAKDCVIWVWSVPDRTPRQLIGHTKPVLSVAISPSDSNTLISSAGDGVRIWDLTTGKQRSRSPFDGLLFWLVMHADTVTGMAFSSDGKRIALSNIDGTVLIWDLDAPLGKSPVVFKGHKGIVNSVAISHDGRQVASGGKDRTVRVWDVETGGEIAKFEGHSKPVSSVAFLPSGDRLVSGSEDKTVRVWSIATGQQVRRFAGHLGRIQSVAVSPDGKLVAVGDWNGRVRLWRLPP